MFDLQMRGDVELHDGTGGVAFKGETLVDFIELLEQIAIRRAGGRAT